jgi:hypothetical protein
MVEERQSHPSPPLLGANGVVAAVLVSAGVGCVCLGVVTVLSEASNAVKTVLIFNTSIGTLSGKAIVTVTSWLVTWSVLHLRWKKRGVDMRRLFVITWSLVAVGILLTFPPLFYLFG